MYLLSQDRALATQDSHRILGDNRFLFLVTSRHFLFWFRLVA